MTNANFQEVKSLEIPDQDSLIEKLEEKQRELDDANNKIQEMKDKLAVALDAAALGSYDLDCSTGLMECSPQCKRNYGVSLDKPFNFSDLLQAIVPEYRETVLAKVQDAILKVRRTMLSIK